MSNTVTWRRTDGECHECGAESFIKNGHEKFCQSCGYEPSEDDFGLDVREPWAYHRDEVRKRASGDVEGRPRLHGGFKGAYYGEGEYEMIRGDGLQL